MMPHEDRQTVEEFRQGDYAAELDLQADEAVQTARKCFCKLRSLLLECPDVVGHYRPAIADLASDFLEVAQQAPRTEP
jgi:hypothetical protein